MSRKYNLFQQNAAAVLTKDLFTVVSSVTWPLNGSGAACDLVVIQTSPFFLCKSSCFHFFFLILFQIYWYLTIIHRSGGE